MRRPDRMCLGLVIALSLGADAPVNPAATRSGAVETIVQGGFDRGLTGWAPTASDSANRVDVVSDSTASSRFAARFVVRRINNYPPQWHTNLVWKNQGLERLEPAVDYVLSFDARASSPRALTVALAREHMPHRNLGLYATFRLGTDWQTYRVRFRTDSAIVRSPGPDNSGPWLSFMADPVPGETRLSSVSLGRGSAQQPSVGGMLSTFTPGDAWQCNGRLEITAPAAPAAHGNVSAAPPSVRVTVPANDLRFLYRQLPFGLPDIHWRLRLRMRVDAPQNVGRIALMLKSPSGDRDYAIASVSRIERDASLVFDRDHFFHHWFSRVRWDSLSTLAIRIETNGNGPLTAEPQSITLEAVEDDGPPAARVLHIDMVPMAAGVVVARCVTDIATTARFAYGPTPRYGRAVRSARPHTVHTFTVPALELGSVYHGRVELPGGRGTGDLAFRVPARVPPRTTRSPFEATLYGVTTPTDARYAGTSGFSVVQSYQLSSVNANTIVDARKYLDTAEAAGLRVVVGFEDEQVVARNVDYVRRRVGALRNHRALYGWYLSDEPEMRNVDPRTLETLARVIRAEDPRHPIVVAASRLGSDYPYRGSFDIAALDDYPIPYAGPGAIVSKLEGARKSGECFHFTFQAYAKDLDDRWPASREGPGRYPTRDEMRVMAFLALNHGASGLGAFSYNYLKQNPGSDWKWIELTDLVREIEAFADVWTSSERSPLRVSTVSDTALDVNVFAAHRDVYVVAVNKAPRPLRATIELSPTVGWKMSRVDADARRATFAWRGRTLSAEWRPYDVHVYRLTRPRLP